MKREGFVSNKVMKFDFQKHETDMFCEIQILSINNSQGKWGGIFWDGTLAVSPHAQVTMAKGHQHMEVVVGS